MKKLYIFLLIAVSAIVITTVTVFHYFTKPVAKTQDVAAEIKIPAEQFAQEFVQDSSKAMLKYGLHAVGQKVLQLNGKLGRSETDAANNIHLFFVTPHAEIQCTMQSDQTAAAKALTKGQEITVKGNLAGYLPPDTDMGEETGTILLNRCVLVK